MPARKDTNLTPLKTAVLESSTFSAFGEIKWDDESLTLKDAPIFGPEFDAKTGFYVSKNDRNYALSFHESVVEEVNKGLYGFDYHPKATARGGYEDRKPKDAFLKSIKGSARLDRSGTVPLVRADLKFKDKSSMEAAKFAGDSMGISLFAFEPLGYTDKATGLEIVAMLDPKSPKKPTLDFVESPSAAPALRESVITDPKEKNAMSPEEIKAMNDRMAELQTQLTKLSGDVAESAKIKAELKTLQQAQTVNSRIAEKKLAPQFVTEGLRKVLTACESVADIDKAIDEHKAMLDKLSDPISEAAKIQRVIVVGDRSMGLDNVDSLINEITATGLQPVLESLVAGQSTSEARNRSFKDKYPKSVLARIGNPKFKDKETRKLRAAILEAWNPKESLQTLSGHRLNTVEDVSEAVLDSSSFSQTLTGLLGAKVIDAYDITSEGFVSPRLMTIFQSSLKTETWVGYSQPTGDASVAEGAAYPDATMVDKYVGHPALTKYGVRVRITREEILWDQKQQVLMRANSVGEALAYDVEDRRIKAIIDNSTTTYYPSGSAAALFTTALGNLAPANPMTGSYLPIEAACNVLTAITDGNSRRLATNSRRPLTILVPQSLFMRAWYAVNPMGTQLRTLSSATVNEAGNPFAGTNVEVSNILDAIDPTTWYISGQGGFQKQYGVKQNIPFEVVQLPQAEVQAVSTDVVGGIRAAIMEAPFAFDTKYVVKVPAV